MASLRKRMLEDMQVRRLSECTQRTYVETVARFARYFDRSPARLGPEQIRAYQVYLTNERRLAPSSLVVAVSALRFLYRVTLQKRWVFDDMIPAPKKPRSLPVGDLLSVGLEKRWHRESSGGGRRRGRRPARFCQEQRVVLIRHFLKLGVSKTAISRIASRRVDILGLPQNLWAELRFS